MLVISLELCFQLTGILMSGNLTKKKSKVVTGGHVVLCVCLRD